MIGAFIQLNCESRYAEKFPVGYIICENGCWEWVGAITVNGYGKLWDGGRKVGAHRWMYEQKYGPVPEGLDLDHFYCDNRGCCNPDHVRPVTNRENVLRGKGHTAANAAKMHCPKGHHLSGDNLVPSILRRGWRECRTCHNERARRYKTTVRMEKKGDPPA